MLLLIGALTTVNLALEVSISWIEPAAIHLFITYLAMPLISGL
jgi:hypothetical protein